MRLDHEIVNIFPVPIYKSNLGREFTKKESKFILENSKKLEPHDPNSMYNAGSEDPEILNHSNMKDLKKDIQKHIDHWFNKMYNPSGKTRLAITTSWLAVTKMGQSHHMHYHTNSILSGVIYFNVASEDAISFVRSPSLVQGGLTSIKDFGVGREKFWTIPTDEYTSYSSDVVSVPVEKNNIIIFPSNMLHMVNQLQEDIIRISLSFNTFFADDYPWTRYHYGKKNN
jgi:hypothetical protein